VKDPFDERCDSERIADAIESLASAIRDLGNGNAATQMGAIENLAKELRDGLAAVASALEDRP
jgi:hypothetical protein